MIGLNWNSAMHASRGASKLAVATCGFLFSHALFAQGLGMEPVPTAELLTADYVNKVQSDESAVAQVMSFAEILELALANNPDINMALSREEQAGYLVKQGKAYRYGEVDVIGQYGPEFNTPSSNTDVLEDTTPGRNFTLRMTKLLYDGGVAKSEYRRRKEVQNASRVETRIVTEDVVSDTVTFYSDVLRFQNARRVAQSFIDEMQELTRKLGLMYEAGAASKVELDFARARLASARAETGNTVASLNDALSNLEFLTGDLPEFIAIPPFELADIDLVNLDQYLERAYRDNSGIMLNRVNRGAEHFRVKAEGAKFYPQFDLELKSNLIADEGGHNETRGNYEVKLNVNYQLFDGFSRRAGLNRAKARLNELEYQETGLLKQLDRSIKLSFNQINATNITLNATRDEIASNKELQRLNRKNLELGEINIIELIDVEERLFNAEADAYRLKSEMYRNYFELMIDSGRVAELMQATQGQLFSAP